MWEKICIFAFLSSLSFWDVRYRRVPAVWMILGSVVVCGYAGYGIRNGEFMWIDCITGVLPGIGILVTARITGKVGIADGWLLLLIGLVWGWRQCVIVLMASLFMISAAAIVLLLMRRVKRDSALPYIPFLAIAVCVGIGAGI